MAYFRQGVALQYLGRHADALAAFASGLAQDPKSLQLLVGMVEAAMKSPLRAASHETPDRHVKASVSHGKASRQKREKRQREREKRWKEGKIGT
ncbi:tetratricopeptide repeat 28-like protein [Labeo rohita]|uniref:Tetratricopeptide repeat 28-like protein n=1 Tax=Labeo rohita TaxID=84645 RepID=A0A498NX37_LABRO|nr:tetratricopeptide repeat 28-like protein [Labeo rohita]